MIDIKIHTSNAAFTDEPTEIGRILRKLGTFFSDAAATGSTGSQCVVLDANGNNVGFAIDIQGDQYNMFCPGKDKVTIDGPNIGRVVLPRQSAIDLCKRLNDELEIFAPFTD